VDFKYGKDTWIADPVTGRNSILLCVLLEQHISTTEILENPTVYIHEILKILVYYGRHLSDLEYRTNSVSLKHVFKNTIVKYNYSHSSWCSLLCVLMCTLIAAAIVFFIHID